LQIMTKSSKTAPDLITFQTVLKAHADLGENDSALRILEQAVQHKIKPDEHMFRTVLSSCAVKPLSSAKVIGCFDKLVEFGMKPSGNTLVIVLKALESSKNWTAALELVESAWKRFGLQPEARMHSQIGFACIKAGDFATAKKAHEALLKIFGSRVANAGASSSLLNDCVKCATLAEAKALAFERPGAGTQRAAATAAPVAQSNRLAQFIELNSLDPSCANLLTKTPPQQVEWIMDQEFKVSVDGQRGTASAKVVGMVLRARHSNLNWGRYPTSRDLAKRVSDFITLNFLNQQCEAELRKLGDTEVQALMDEDFYVKADAASQQTTSAKVLKMIKNHQSVKPAGSTLAGLLAEFVNINQLDDRCARTLRSLPRSDVASIIDQEGLRLSVDRSKGTASAKVCSMIATLRANDSRIM